MLAEFEWYETKITFLGVVIQNPITNKTKLNEDFCLPKLIEIFGKEAFLKGFESDQEWLENNINTRERFKGFIWYPSSFECSQKDQYESITLLYENNRLHLFDSDNFSIKYHKLNGLYSFGYEIFQNCTIDFNNFNDFVLKCLRFQKIPHKTINKRNIYYLDQLTKLNLDELTIKFNEKIYEKIKTHLNCENLELWNAFVVIVPSNISCPDQVVHRDCLYDSVSLFFYLDEPTDPGTGFFPFTHRLLLGVKDNCSKPQFPKLNPLDILMMDGKLYHYGLGNNEQVENHSNRMLYVFQYRDKSLIRSKRTSRIKFIEDKIQQFPDQFPTLFKIR